MNENIKVTKNTQNYSKMINAFFRIEAIKWLMPDLTKGPITWLFHLKNYHQLEFLSTMTASMQYNNARSIFMLSRILLQ